MKKMEVKTRRGIIEIKKGRDYYIDDPLRGFSEERHCRFIGEEWDYYKFRFADGEVVFYSQSDLRYTAIEERRYEYV